MRYVILKAKSFLQTIQRPFPALTIGVALFVIAALAAATGTTAWPNCAGNEDGTKPCNGYCANCTNNWNLCISCCQAVCSGPAEMSCVNCCTKPQQCSQ